MTIKYLNTTKTSYFNGEILYSYYTPVAIVGLDRTLLVDEKKYSSTTSKQITQCANRYGYNRKTIPHQLFKEMVRLYNEEI